MFESRVALLPFAILLAGQAFAVSDVRVNFTLNTRDPYGAPIQQKRTYTVYRPDNLSKSTPAPMVLLMDPSTPSTLHRKADQAGFVVVSCSFSGNSTGVPGTVWTSDNPRVVGYEDYDYVDEVIRRVRESDNCNDAFTVGLSKGGHMSLAYACERPNMIKAAASLDEFMQLTSNYPSAPVPIIVFQGTLDTNVPYVMVKDTVDAWRAVDGLLSATPVKTYEPSPLVVGKASQATWRGGINGTQVAYVTLIGGTHTYPTPTVQTGYDYTDGVWAFFSQFLTSAQDAPKIVSQPVDNIQLSGQPASFWVSATGADPLRYQWQKNGEDIPGATSNWYTVPAATEDGAMFQAVVSNDAGAVTSPAAKVMVKVAPAGPVITAQPQDQIVVAGQPVSFAVTATGAAPITYQWQKNGVNVAGATSASLDIPAAISADCGASFTAIVRNSAGTVTSTRATLTVTPAPGAPIMLTNPVRSRVLIGQTGTFSVNAWSASPVSYQWQKGTLTGNMADIPGATGAAYTTPPATLADHLTLYRCIVTNAAGNTTSAAEMMAVTTDPTPPTKITSDVTAAAQAGAPFSFTIVSSGGTSPVTFSASPLPAGLTLDANSGVISGMPTDTGVTSITVTASNRAGSYSAVLTMTVTDTAPAMSIGQWRLANFGASATDPTIAGDMADPDGDGYTNLDEFNAGTNPLDPTSVPQP